MRAISPEATRVERTPVRDAKAAQWLDEYLEIVAAEGWSQLHQDYLRLRLRSLPRVDNLCDAHAGIMNFLLSSAGWDEKTVEQCDTYIASRMTWYSVTDRERAEYLAHYLGTSPEQILKMGAGKTRLSDDEACALYRHYDADGVLLYVGISQSPSLRRTQHESHSKWFRFVEDTTEEWFDDRGLADQAERVAIEDECPIFNEVHNKRGRDQAVEYLLHQLPKGDA